VIQKLAEAGPLSMNGLAARTHTHQSSASTVASRLVDAGYIRRARSGDDGRSVELSLTAKGRRLAGRSPGLAQDRLVRGIEQLTTARRRALALALADLTHAMDAAGAAPSMFFEDGRRRASGRHHD
jgi:DNA-binding MarR family transcriptional regulator